MKRRSERSQAGPGTLVLSLDLELHWGVRDRRSVEAYRTNLDGTRAAVNAMLERFADHGVAATWAVVGLLFCDGRDEALRWVPSLRPGYDMAGLDPYADLEACGGSEAADPYHFAPSLVDAIRRTPGQELATHTFSHFFCLEEGSSPASFRADLEAAVAVAQRDGVRLRSIVFGRNQYDPDYLEVCREVGFVAFRATTPGPMWTWNGSAHEGLPRRVARYLDAYVPLSGRGPVTLSVGPSGLVALPASQFLRPTDKADGLATRLRMRRIVAGMTRAARTGGVFHLWWHPENFGAHLDENLAQLDTVLETFLDLEKRDGMRSATMGDLADEMTSGRIA